MRLLELFTEYVTDTVPVISMPVPLLFFSIYLQAASPCISIYNSIRRRSPMERMLLSLPAGVFILTYSIMDGLLGGSFLGGGFSNFAGLRLFYGQGAVLWEIGGLLVLFPLLSLTVDRWNRHLPRWVTLPGDFIVWIFYAICLTGTLQLAELNPLTAAFRLSDSMLLWYTYSIFAILFQSTLSLAAIFLHGLFSERFPKNIAVLSQSDQWCTKQIQRLLLSGHRTFLYAILPLIAIIASVIYGDIRSGTSVDSYTSSPTLLVFGLVILGFLLVILLRTLFPSLVAAVRQVRSWPDGAALRRLFCQEYFDEDNPPEVGEYLEVSEHFAIIRNIRPLLVYLPHVREIDSRQRSGSTQFLWKLTEDTEVVLPLLNKKDLALLSRTQERLRKGWKPHGNT